MLVLRFWVSKCMGTVQCQMLVMTFIFSWAFCCCEMWCCITFESLFREFQWVILISFLQFANKLQENICIKGAPKIGDNDFRAPLVSSSSSSWVIPHRHGGIGFLRTIRHSFLLPSIEVRDATFYFTSSNLCVMNLHSTLQGNRGSKPPRQTKDTQRPFFAFESN